MSATASILARLEKVRQTGPSTWVARCPAHEDRRPSLSIRADEDRVLVHCFSGCEISAVLSAVGLSLSDLFSSPVNHSTSGLARPFPAMDALRALAVGALVVSIVAKQMRDGHVPTAPEMVRLSVAVERFQRAVEVVQPNHRKGAFRGR